MQGYCDIFLWAILKRTSTEAHVYMRRHQGAKIEHFDVSNVIHHIFSHGAVSYTLNEENVNVMLEFFFIVKALMTLKVKLFSCLKNIFQHFIFQTNRPF